MDARGYCQDRLESSGTGDVQSAEKPTPVPHPRHRSGAQTAVLPCHHGHDLQHWPVGDTLILGAHADAVPSARAYLRQLLSGWGLAELSPDAGVVISELVTNAVAASAELRLAAAPVLVWHGSDSRCLLLAVADASPRTPVRLKLKADAEGGRGLALVEALCSRWGWYPANTAGLRKVVWAEWLLRPSETMSAEEQTMQEPPTPDSSRSHDVSGLTDAELERTRPELQASLALARPGSATRVPILTPREAGMIHLPTPYAAARIAAFLNDHPSWSAYWDKRSGLWRVAEDDTDSDLYAENRDADAVIRYMSAHS
jgi:hypothetical protein